MVKPRGPRRKPVVLSSDDEEDDIPTSVQTSRPTRTRTLRSQTTQTHDDKSSSDKRKALPIHKTDTTGLSAPTKSASSSPQKKIKKQPAAPVTKEKAIYSFFNKQTQRQQRTTPPLVGSERQVGSQRDVIEEEEDFIQDDSLDEQDILVSSFKAESSTALTVRKRNWDSINVPSKAEPENVVVASQKFRKTDQGRVSNPSISSTPRIKNDTRPWVDRLAPRNLDELSVHSKKVADVRQWLTDVFGGKQRKRLLVLKGPSGSAKTTTLRLLSQELGFHIQEWMNPTSSIQTDQGFVSMAAQFEDFISRSEMFHSLEISRLEGSSVRHPDLGASSGIDKVILIEDFPATLSSSSSPLLSFRSAIIQYLQASMSPADAVFGHSNGMGKRITPVILVISETLLSSSSATGDSFTAHRLLGPDILTHPGTTLIEFNPIAPTILSKALNRVVRDESRLSGRRTTPGPEVIKRLAEIGDIRSAISTLEFLCLRGDDRGNWGSRISFAKSKKSAKDVPMTRMEEESLQMITQRESTLGIFHSVGKVVYNNRVTPDTNHVTSQPPTYLPQHRRAKMSEVRVDDLLNELGTDIQTFISALHENYALSCGNSSDEDTLESLDDCIGALSDADLLSPDKFSISAFARRSFQGTAADNLRQEETSFQVAVRGLLFNLPHPVKRQSAYSGPAHRAGGRDQAHQMYYPTSLRLWRKREEIEGLLDMWVSRARQGKLMNPSGSSFSRPSMAVRGVGTWRRASEAFSGLSADDASADDWAVTIGGGSSARREMLLERLPYMRKTFQKSKNTALAQLVRDLEKVVAMDGIGSPSSAEPNDGDGEVDGQADSIATRVRSGTPNAPGLDTSEVGEQQVAALVLSDDDIEDD